jgi:hypothetical protein
MSYSDKPKFEKAVSLFAMFFTFIDLIFSCLSMPGKLAQTNAIEIIAINGNSLF